VAGENVWPPCSLGSAKTPTNPHFSSQPCESWASPDEPQVLEHLTVRLVQPHEAARYDARMVAHHYLKSDRVVGEHLR